MSRKTPYEVSGSSLVNLKAELYRKQEESKRRGESKPTVGFQQGYVSVKNNTLKSKIASKSTKLQDGKNGSKQPSIETSSEDVQSWEKAKASLAAKAKLYDKMASEHYTPDEGEDEHLLVDFSRKIHDVRNFDQRQSARYSSDSESEEDFESAGPVPPPRTVDEEWTEYEDYLGRSRKCLKKDLPSLLEADGRRRQEHSSHSSVEKPEIPILPTAPAAASFGFDFGQSPLEHRTLMSEDMRREMQRQQWEQEQDPDVPNPTEGKVPIHYQSVENNEIRNLGVGYYKFSKDEGTRDEELENLKKLHEQTVNQRSQKEQVKAKRKAAMDARLAKVRERKLLKGEVVADPNKDVDDDDEFERKLLETKPAPVSFVEDLTPMVKAGSRAWDKGKVNPEFQDKLYVDNRRQDRNMDFAPPSFYSAPSNPTSKKKFRPTNKQSREFVDNTVQFPSHEMAEEYSSPAPDPDYQPWEHIQPWKERMNDGATHLQPADEKKPWAFAPPPTVYSESESSNPMQFGRVSQDEIREQARKLFSSQPGS